VLDGALARRSQIARAAGLRNRLVQDYDEIDHRLSSRRCKTRSRMFPLFDGRRCVCQIVLSCNRAES
jgi:uncharacterized protein YutE (UPF0331/DUF86 family)